MTAATPQDLAEMMVLRFGADALAASRATMQLKAFDDDHAALPAWQEVVRLLTA